MPVALSVMVFGVLVDCFIGDVWEWVQDWYGKNYYQNSPTNNPKGPSDGSDRGLRGGAAGSAISLMPAPRFASGVGLTTEPTT